MQKRFRLAESPEAGVYCDERGLFVGGTPLLERTSDVAAWRPRPLAHLNRTLSQVYELEIDVLAKLNGIAAVAKALERNDIAHAQLITLFLRIPDPPTLSKASGRAFEQEVLGLAANLGACRLLKLDWDPAKHPRWPAGTAGGVGGQFSPEGEDTGPSGDQSAAHLTQGGIAVPFPGEIPEVTPRPYPLPSEIVPPPIAIPNALPRNPYPDRPECAREWEDAEKYCADLARRGLLGKHPYIGHGNLYDQCVRGQVSADCGGNVVRV